MTGVPEGLDKLLFGVGLLLVLIIRGGFSVSSGRLTRFYSIHTFLLPIVTLSLVIIHFIHFIQTSITENATKIGSGPLYHPKIWGPVTLLTKKVVVFLTNPFQGLVSPRRVNT